MRSILIKRDANNKSDREGAKDNMDDRNKTFK